MKANTVAMVYLNITKNTATGTVSDSNRIPFSFPSIDLLWKHQLSGKYNLIYEQTKHKFNILNNVVQQIK